MRILGIDPGYGILGWSIIETGLKLIDYGTIETESHQDLDDRLLDIHKKLCGIIEMYQPGTAALEKLFFTKNISTGMDVAKTIGAVILTLKLHNLKYTEYTPSQVKQAVTGYGRAGKEQMKTMIKTIFSLKEFPHPDDAADACAIAICHSLQKTYR